MNSQIKEMLDNNEFLRTLVIISLLFISINIVISKNSDAKESLTTLTIPIKMNSESNVDVTPATITFSSKGGAPLGSDNSNPTQSLTTNLLINTLILVFTILGYWISRNKLLEIRRLYALSGTSYFQTPMFILSLIFLATLPIIYFYHLFTGNNENQSHFINELSFWFDNHSSARAIYIAFLSVFIFHFFDYFRIHARLSQLREKGLEDSFKLIANIVEYRFPQDKKKVAEFFDRGITKEQKNAIIESIQKHLITLEKTLAPDRKKFGVIANLYHPDYLPHLSYIYLENSQLRALNVPPRRVQLLGRKWTKKGLVSEYVVVHNVSDIQRGYVEPENLKADNTSEPDKLRKEQHKNLKKIAKMLLKPEKGVTTPSLEPDAKLTKLQLNNKELVYRMYREISENLPMVKWSQRSLKKRCLVTVAPDGTLLQISIEEERQINV